MVKEFKELGINYLKEIKSIRSFQNQAIGKFSTLNEKNYKSSYNNRCELPKNKQKCETIWEDKYF